MPEGLTQQLMAAALDPERKAAASRDLSAAGTEINILNFPRGHLHCVVKIYTQS